MQALGGHLGAGPGGVGDEGAGRFRDDAHRRCRNRKRAAFLEQAKAVFVKRTAGKGGVFMRRKGTVCRRELQGKAVVWSKKGTVLAVGVEAVPDVRLRQRLVHAATQTRVSLQLQYHTAKQTPC